MVSLINRERLLKQFVQLLNINSPSRKEGEIGAVLVERLKSLGFEVKFDDAGEKLKGECGNLIATLPASGSGFRNILLCAHMDTVQPTEGIRVIREGGIIRQEGAAVLGADDKAGVAAILEGLQSALENNDPHGQVQVVILICEEIGLLGSKALDMGLVDSDYGFVLDSGQPVGHLVSEAPHHENIKALFTGKAAHAGVCPEEGIDAVRAACIAVSRMKLGRIDQETTANVGIISGGSARNIVPEKCELRAEARSRDPQKLEQQVRDMRQEMERGAEETGAQVDIRNTREYEGYKHSRESDLIRFALRAADRAGMAPDLVAHGGGSDCNILNARGLPTALIGVGYEKIHTSEEYIAEDNVVRTAEVVRALIQESAGHA